MNCDVLRRLLLAGSRPCALLGACLSRGRRLARTIPQPFLIADLIRRLSRRHEYQTGNDGQ